ncbi:GNAT family N-acetyltransferase [Fulvivirga sp. M361]|uniref:GNAT family N-acetyltransferase n=1 Tax=Fulvivirga sp. M361 TaxID=2594266 RepID=UPI001624CECB|nr:GNAT family N-acetyltransferase [Fulvivirga sp. M361]
MRRALAQDISEIQGLIAGTIESTCKDDYDRKQLDVWVSSIKNKRRWNSVLEKQFALVATADDKIVGFASLENGEYLDFLYVHKDYLRQGIANKLYEELKTESERLGHNTMTSNVSKTARSFFECKGFKVIHENKHVIDAVEINNFHMVLRIPDAIKTG